MMTTEEAITLLRADPDRRAFIEETYLDEDTTVAAERFAASVELAQTVRLLGEPPAGETVVDLGAGTGISSWALARLGARLVVAVEPDRSPVVGLGSLTGLVAGEAVAPVAAVGGGLPVASASVDLVYARQVLHHIPALGPTLAECARVLRPGGRFVATREHVVDDEDQLQEFLAGHPVHQLAGGEGAHRVRDYRGAIEGAGLVLDQMLGPWDSVLNAYPAVLTDDELARAPETIVGRRFGPGAARVAGLPGVRQVLWARLRRARPGRLFSFVAHKPGA